MKIKFAFILILITFQFVVYAQNELVIELTTDNNSEETQWVLFDTYSTVVQTKNTLADLTTYRDTIQLSGESCYYWTLYDSYGDGLNGGFTPGSYRIFYNGVLISQSENANFGDSISVYNLGAACISNDSKVLQVEMLSYLSKDTVSVFASVLNMATTAITSLEVSYEVGDYKSAPITVDGLNIPIGATALIKYPTAHNFTSAGDYTISYFITKVNGTADTFTDNNMASKQVTVVDGIVFKNLIEDFASFECSYCPDADAAVHAAVNDYPGTYSLVKYMCWEFADTKYFPEIELYRDYYANNGGVPVIMINGGYRSYTTITPPYYSELLGITTPIKLTISGELKGDSLVAHVKVFSNELIDYKLVLRGIIQEKESYDVSKNFENSDPYYDIAYTMINGIDAIEIDGIQAGETKDFTATLSIVGLPLEEGSLTDMKLVFFIQNYTYRNVLQSADFDLSYTTVEPELTYNIDNGSATVDTANLKIVVNSNRYLLDKDGSSVDKVKNHFVLKQGTINGTSVPFNATINESFNTITIVPTYEWSTETNYFLITKDFTTLENLTIPNDTLTFKTLPYIGISEDISNSIKIFPNPAVNSITITGQKGKDIQILSITGQLIEEFTNPSGTIEHNISNYASGVYFIKTNTNQGPIIEKFLKQ